MRNDHGTEHSTAGFSVERIARNDAIFREANEGVRDFVEGEGVGDDENVPFVCECADPNCRDLVRMTLDDYRMMREDPRLFVNVPGHEVTAQGWAEVIAGRDGHVIVEKIGRAGDIAVQLEDESLLPPARVRE